MIYHDTIVSSGSRHNNALTWNKDGLLMDTKRTIKDNDSVKGETEKGSRLVNSEKKIMNWVK